MILFYSIEIEYKYNIFRFESNKSIFICHFIYKTDHERTDLTITANDHMAEQNASKIIRDKSCSHLKELVDEELPGPDVHSKRCTARKTGLFLPEARVVER